MDMKRHILFAMCSCLLSLAVAQNNAVNDIVQVRFIESSFHRGVIRMKDDRSARTLYLSEPIFALRDVDSARVYSGYDSKGKPYSDVIIRFKRALRDSMQRITARHLHSRIAIIVDGKLTTPMIMNPFREPLISVVKSSESEAKDLARRITEAVKNK